MKSYPSIIHYEMTMPFRICIFRVNSMEKSLKKNIESVIVTGFNRGVVQAPKSNLMFPEIFVYRQEYSHYLPIN